MAFIPALIMANGARMEGIEASRVLHLLRVERPGRTRRSISLKVPTVGNSALNMAMPMLGTADDDALPDHGWVRSPASAAFATHLMNKEMEKLDIPPVREFLELISDSGGKLFACKLAMDMFKLKREDLCDRVDDVLTVGQFYEEAAGEGSHILFT
jgi:peroxiredoxin family protein